MYQGWHWCHCKNRFGAKMLNCSKLTQFAGALRAPNSSGDGPEPLTETFTASALVLDVIGRDRCVCLKKYFRQLQFPFLGLVPWQYSWLTFPQVCYSFCLPRWLRTTRTPFSSRPTLPCWTMSLWSSLAIHTSRWTRLHYPAASRICPPRPALGSSTRFLLPMGKTTRICVLFVQYLG